ncbi:unnamed protein product [Pylaiella littoralis]
MDAFRVSSDQCDTEVRCLSLFCSGFRCSCGICVLRRACFGWSTGYLCMVLRVNGSASDSVTVGAPYRFLGGGKRLMYVCIAYAYAVRMGWFCVVGREGTICDGFVVSENFRVIGI